MKINTLEDLYGKRVIVTGDSGWSHLYFVGPRHTEHRRIGAVGVVTGHVPGCGGDVVWVQHEDNPNIISAYCHLDELEFYSEEAVKFAQQKLNHVILLQNRLTQLQQEIKTISAFPYEDSSWHVPTTA